jgi:HEAT repeat protein
MVVNAYPDVDFESWELWWDFNQDQYLWGDGSLLGTGERSGRLAGAVTGSGSRVARGQWRGQFAANRARLLSTLLGALEAETSRDLRCALLLAAAKCASGGDPSAVRQVAASARRALVGDLQLVRESALMALGILADPADADLLISLCSDSPEGRLALGSPGIDPRTRTFAAFALGALAERCESPGLQQTIARALLGQLPEPTRVLVPDLPVALLLALARTRLPSDGSAPEPATQSAPWASCEALLAHLLGRWSDPEEDLKLRPHLPAVLVSAYGCIPPSRAQEAQRQRLIEALLLPLSSDRRKVRRANWSEECEQSAVQALGLLGDADGDPLDLAVRYRLQILAQDAMRQTKRYALIALAQVTSRPGNHYLPGTSPSWALSSLPEGAEFLRQRLSAGKGGDEYWAALAIGVQGYHLRSLGLEPPTENVQALLSRLQRFEDADNGGSCAIALGLLQQGAAAEVLLDSLTDVTDWETQGWLALGLGLMGARQAQGPILNLMLRGKFRSVLTLNAAPALGLVAEPRELNELLPLLKSALSDQPWLQAALAQALGLHGGPANIDPLLEVLCDLSQPSKNRAYAAAALGMLGASDRRPWTAGFSQLLNYRCVTSTLSNLEGNGLLNQL